jgi:hypothetical protein
VRGYAALGVPDGEGGLGRFLTSGPTSDTASRSSCAAPSAKSMFDFVVAAESADALLLETDVAGARIQLDRLRELAR